MKILREYFRRQIAVFWFCISLFLLNPATYLSQRPAEVNRTEKTAKQKIEDPAITRWKIFLDSLVQESRTVFPEERRPYAMVEVANAYWEVDREESRKQFLAAFDAALSLTRKDRKHQSILNHVLSVATRRDPALAKVLTKKLSDEKDTDGTDDISSEAALDLLESNPEAATQIAEAFAPNGLRDGSAAYLILRIAGKDRRLSDRVYRTYLNRVIADQNIPVKSVLPLAGYSFGYAEYYSINGGGQSSGSTLRPITGFSANPSFTIPFLNLAFRRIAVAIERRNRATGGDIDALNFPILFALEYLMPEVAKYSPNTLSMWQDLHQQGIVGTTTPQIQQVQAYIQRIYQSRIRAQRYNDSSQTPEQEAEASLENVEKLPGTCQRDVIYSEAALTFSSRKNFKKALEIADKIEDLKQEASVQEVILINMAESAIESNDLEDAQKKAEKIASLEQRAILFVKLAQAIEEKNGSQEITGETIKLTEKLSNSGDRAGIFLSLSTILLKRDPIEAASVFRNGVKNLNKQEPNDQMNFSIPLKVSLSCQGGEDKWYGGFETLPSSNIFEAINLFAERNPDETVRLAEEIDDKITRIRSLAMISRVALRKYASKVELPKAAPHLR